MLKLLKETFIRVRLELKKEVELKRQLKELAKLPLNYELIQNIINSASQQINPIEVEIKGSDYVMTIKPCNLNGEVFKSFRERYDSKSK